MNHLFYSAILLVFWSSIFHVSEVKSQDLESCSNLLDQIGNFEGQRDPKCAATANRLEDFIYGTPLMESSRVKKADLQKALILAVWSECDSLEKLFGSEKISILTMKSVLTELADFKETDLSYELDVAGRLETITKRDLKHYGSVAYAYRAILSVQQQLLFDSDLSFLPLSKTSTDELKSFIDKSTLVVLKIADQNSRKENLQKIDPEIFESAWVKVFNSDRSNSLLTIPANTSESRKAQLQLIKEIIAKKQEAFQEYNDISMFVFQRNAQVYFSRHGWPKDDTENQEFRMFYNEALIQFVKDVWLLSEEKATEKGKPFIGLQEVDEALEAYLPFTANQLEDITFFPRLERSKQVDVEAYDLDAFRDGGAHWTYIQMALGDEDFKPTLMPDPFALELLSEGIAHLGVLSLRVAGHVSKESQHARLSKQDLIAGFERIQKLLRDHAVADTKEEESGFASSTVKSTKSKLPFTNITANSGVQFEHRSADWLSRFIRSYSVDSTENEMKTSIPPAFGGGGVAAEDVDNDGYPDLLLLSGLGNKLFVNNGDGTFSDKTDESNLGWKRADRTAGEPRQPIIADFDNDGNQDVFISYVNDVHRIYKGNGDGTFSDMTVTAGLDGSATVGGPCTALDFDGDGLLDVYIGYFGDYLNGISPTLARRNKNGLLNKLFRNLGGFKFGEVKNSGAEDTGWSQSIGHSDINGDHHQDLIVGNDFGTNTYYINQGDGTFIDKTRELGTDKPSFSMNVGITDLNKDHRPDFYISNIVVMEKDEKYVNPSANSKMKFNADVMANMRVVEANDLFISNRTEDGTSYSLSRDISRGYSATGWSWDADFFDYDNDGDQDLYCLTGMNDFLVYSSENPYYQDSDGIGKSVTFAESHREANVFFENEGGQLVAGENESGLEVVHNSRSAAYFDMDMDGDEDVIINNYHDAAVLFQNNSDKLKNNWIKIRLEGDPTKGITRDAIGATITVTANGLDVWREIHSTIGYLSVHPKEQHIGLAKNDIVDVQVVWPNGRTDHFGGLEAGKRYLIEVGQLPVIIP